MDFAEGCSEVDFILEHLNIEEKKKIPETVIKFFKDNKAIFYEVKITPQKPLKEQQLKEETKIFLKIIHYKFFANSQQKKDFESILENKTNIELETFDIEKTDMRTNTEINGEIEKDIKTELMVVKENKILAFFKKIFKMLKIN